MQPLNFVRNWNTGKEREKLLSFSPESLVGVKITIDAHDFLIEAGLPEVAAPFLNFEVPENGSLPTVSQEWKLSENYSHFRLIGFNGSGDPICLDENAFGAVIYLNHDNHFERVLINSSVLYLAESLLIIRNYLEKEMTAEQEIWCLQKLKEVDEAAWQESEYWRNEIIVLRTS